MNVMVVSGLAWTHHREAALRLVRRAAAQEVPATLYIDAAAVASEVRSLSEAPERVGIATPVADIPFERWLRPGHVDGGVLDEHAIRSAPSKISAEHIVIVDARSHRAALVTHALSHVRHAWFPLDEWHPGFVLIADDADQLALGDALSGTFYCQPQMLSDLSIKRMTRGIMRHALLMRWLGPNYKRFQQKVFYKYVDRFTEWTSRRVVRIEERR